MEQLRCLYFEDEDEDFEFFEVYFKHAFADRANLIIERAKTPDDAYRKLKRGGKNLKLFFADLLIKKDPTQGLLLVEFVTKTFPHVLVIGISNADGTLPGTSNSFKKAAGDDSVFFDKKALRGPRYSYGDVVAKVMKVARRKNILTSSESPSGDDANADNSDASRPIHGEDKTAKYVFLDIVAFTRNRSVNAQADVIKQLNTIVSETIEERQIGPDDRLFLPTGDGLCIVLLRDHPIDNTIQVALGILERLANYNASTTDEKRNFQVRIGIESGEDVLVTDINGQQNIAGEGINTASRTMDLADGGHILVGERVYNSLNSRDFYPGKFRHYPAIVKHGRELSVYQFVDEGRAGLNLEMPKRLADPSDGGTEKPHFIHGNLVELFGLIEKRIARVDRLRIYANATTSVQPLFANSRLQAERCEMILREPGRDEPESANFRQHLGHMLKQWDELKRAKRIGEFECRRNSTVPTEWQIIFDDRFIICGLRVPDRSDWLGVVEIEPFLVENSSPEGKFFIDKYVDRFDRFFALTKASPASA